MTVEFAGIKFAGSGQFFCVGDRKCRGSVLFVQRDISQVIIDYVLPQRRGIAQDSLEEHFIDRPGHPEEALYGRICLYKIDNVGGAGGCDRQPLGPSIGL